MTSMASVDVLYRKDGIRFKLNWRADGNHAALSQEISPDNWQNAEGDIRHRFPVRIYSQKQIFELARNPQALLAVLDEAPAVSYADWQNQWNQEETTFMSLRARHRELLSALSDEVRLRGALADVDRKIELFESEQNAATLQAYSRVASQQAAIEGLFRNVDALSPQFDGLVERVVPLALPPDLFDSEQPADRSAIDAVAAANLTLQDTRRQLSELSTALSAAARHFRTTVAGSSWRTAFEAAETSYNALVASLREQGVPNSDEYAGLVRQRDALNRQLDELTVRRSDAQNAEAQARQSLLRLKALRGELNLRRGEFLQSVLRDNPHVRMTLVPFGERVGTEAALRQILQKETNHFQQDIGTDAGPDGLLGRLFDSYPGTTSSEDFLARLESIKELILGIHSGNEYPGARDQRFVAHIRGLPPECTDRMLAWWPHDTLKVEYATARGVFTPIAQGSPGQKTAAILAFLLAYGEEPMVLDQPEDDLDNHLIYDLIVQQIRKSKGTRQLIVATHNPNIVVNGDAELIVVMHHRNGQCCLDRSDGLYATSIREAICQIMEGGRDAFDKRYQRIQPLAI